ncbi:MAG: phage tail protein [Rhodoferax sp.]|nr:phage tail protein [Rhodoferax sp.]MDP3650530.1 phage tail protein [Rhodoferax sp.]
MSGLFGGGAPNTANAEMPLTGMSIQSSAYGVTLAFGYGRTRVSPNLLWYGDFTAVPHTSSQSTGGKGGGGGGSSSTTYTYTASYALALGEAVTSVNRVWINKLAAVDVNTIFTVFTGADPQTPWSYLSGAHPGEALGYSGISYVAVAGRDLGTHTNLSNHSFDVTLKLPLGGSVHDADPGQILPDLLTNVAYGVPNFPASRLSDLSSYSAYCRAAGLLLSPLYDKPQAASQIITSLMRLTNSGVYFSEGVLKVTPYGDSNISGHGASYTANLTPLANFTEDDFLVSGSEDPVRVKRNAIPETVSGSADAYNQVTLEILDRSQDYRPVPVVAQDMVSIDTIGLRPMSTITAHEIADAAVGQAVANLILQRVLNIRATYEWSAGWQWCRLEPTDIVSITEPALGMDGYPVRILTIEEDGETGGLKFSAEDVPFGIGHHVAAPTPTLGGYAVNQAILPGPTNTPVIFEPPNSLTSPDFQLWIAASGGVNWGGCEVWASDDGTSYRRVGVITNPARHGTLTSLLSSGSDPDTAHALNVELGACRGQLLPGTTADADMGNTLLWVDGELIAYAGATLTGSNAYSLSYLRRGIKGTANATHAGASQFVHIDDALFRYTIATDRIGTPIWLKFPAFNTFGFSLESLADVDAYQHTFAGNKPLALTALTATGGMFQVTLAWAFNATQIDLDYTEIWGATTNNRASANLLSSVKTPATTWIHPGLQPAQTWYYWARAVDTSGNKGNHYPTSATGGIFAAPSSDPSALLTQLKSSIGMGQLAAELVAPITLMPQAESANAIAALQSALSDWDITNRMQFQEAVTNATVTVDPLTGQIQLLATAIVTTDVESRLTAVEVTANADHGTLTSTVATVAAVEGNLTTAQGQITTMAGQLASSASQVYVDESVANATGALTVTAANAASALAQAEIQSALDAFTQGTSLTAMTANVATAQEQIQTTANALEAVVVSKAALIATVAGQGAAILNEETVRTTAVAALATRATVLEALVNSGTSGLATKASVAYVDAAKADAISASASSIATLTSSVQTAQTTADTGVANAAAAQGTANTGVTNAAAALAQANTATTNAATAQSTANTAVTASSANASSINTLTSSVQTAQATADTGVANAAAAQGTANTGVSNAAAALAQANTATTNAATAQSTANTAVTASSANANSINTLTSSVQTAQATADTGVANAAAAQGTANTGVSNAAAALAQANTATTNAATAQSTANTAVTASSANASSINTLTSSVQTAQATADTGVANAAAAQGTANTGVTNAAAALAQANTAVTASSANASSVSALSARLDTGDFADVQIQSSANASALAGMVAKWAVQVQTMANGRRALAGLQLIAGTDGESEVGILADKLVVYKPDGTGAPVPIMILGTVNGTSALGLDGSLVVDGSVVARSLSVQSLSSITATIGTLRTATTGARLEIHDNVIKVFDSANVVRVKIGDLSL